MLPVLLACAPPDPIRVPGGTTEPPGETVPLLADALDARCPGIVPNPGPVGDDLHRVTLDTAATCNDGSPPVVYVRAATDPEHARDWVVYVDGGSFCSDYETCAVRWCGEDRVYDAGKMSSAWAADAIGAGGMRSRDASNAFAGWNHAMLHYCSSDFWTGTAGDHVFDGDPPYRLRFEGHAVVLAALDALETGVTSDDAAEALPSLDDAATILFTGSSAGGFGAGEHLGDVVARVPGARVIGVIDSFLPPPTDLMTPDEAAARNASVKATWDDILVPIWDGAVDADCLAANADPWRCSDLDVVLRGSVTAELAVHQDLFDPVLYPTYDEIGMTQRRLADLWTAGLHLYADTVPGVALHGSRCPHHTALSEDEWFARLTVDDDAGTPWSLHDLLVAQLAGGPPVAIDAADGARTTCP